ncbi:hypothetical protein Tco_0815925 [Tanacetum coccineum]
MTDNIGKKVICYNCRGKGPLRRKGIVFRSEAEAFLADVEYAGPYVAATFMANLSSTSRTNGVTTSQEEHLDSDVELDIDDNTIPYHQYQLDSEVQDVPAEEQSLVNDSLRAELARCKQEMVSLECNKVKHDLDQAIIQRNKRNVELEEENVLLNEDSFVHAKVSRTKMSERLGTIKPINYAELNALYSHFVPQKELSREQVYWLPTAETTSQSSTPAKPVTPFGSYRLARDQFSHLFTMLQHVESRIVTCP